ncbi:hypothetical protein VFPPC_15767 [Pochonia chlamydosporia 170]|uniref:Uncharacterized protein n=1 Tax=Pochonia chlamydosporia 170 TaxID=1380566 RepID=A0A179FSG0_METCM|nr:hypothetical protein VFPPC_15767 [Pochonia chlamydosporia 170]OAQ68023.1 hypothetical protein VFPPC_15767 [Pochonia chlamydosporia 170]
MRCGSEPTKKMVGALGGSGGAIRRQYWIVSIVFMAWHSMESDDRACVYGGGDVGWSISHLR